MADVVFVVLAVGFFGLCVAYVHGLGRLVRTADDTPSDDAPDDTANAADPPTGGRSRRAPGQTHARTGETVDAVEAADEHQ